MTQYMLVLHVISIKFVYLNFSAFNNESSTINLNSIPLLSQTLSNINYSESDVYNALSSLELNNKAIGIDAK